MLTLSDFNYSLPDELIAQTPPQERGTSRLLVANANTKIISDEKFSQLPQILKNHFLGKPVLVIVNDSRVYPARVRINRISGARGEVFLLETGEKLTYRCLLRPTKKLHEGELLYVGDVPVFKVESLTEPQVSLCGLTLKEVLEKYGEMPLPPYIVRDPKQTDKKFAELDKERYQTVYSQESGSAAAPTAGLHFTREIMDECENQGIMFSHVTLHVGLGTFQPVQTENLQDHKMHAEHFSIPKTTFDLIEKFKANDHPIVFVGTTALRAVESFYLNRQNCQPGQWHETNLFIRPQGKEKDYQPQVGSALITNFHQPESTLVMLVASLLSYTFWQKVYDHALKEKYSFLSYGDSNLYVFRNL